jgi:release factor glutamine methyltransferase
MPAQNIPNRVWTVIDIIRWGTQYFADRGIESARLTIELMLCSVLQVQRISLYSDHERPLTASQLAMLRGYVQRRIRFEPLQYILGKAEFYGSTFVVNPSVLIPRPETEHIVEEVLSWCKQHTATHLLDIGTGSGAIAISIGKRVQGIHLTLLDAASDALDIAKGNAETLVPEVPASFVHANILQYTPEQRFTIITMNPPYIPANDVSTLQPEVRDFEPHIALTDDSDGLTFYRWAAQNAQAFLCSPGLLAMELGFGQADAVVPMFSSLFSTRVVPDLQGVPRVLLAHV